MSEKHKRLLRRAANIQDAHRDYGMCVALARAYDLSRTIEFHTYHNCRSFIPNLYWPDSEYREHSYWMGPDFTEEQKAHRVMALLFAAEAYDDMKGVR